METITFYSYKGGSGRSLALANAAVYLAKLGFRVVALDFGSTKHQASTTNFREMRTTHL